MEALFTIKNNFQRRNIQYQDILTLDILTDICLKITGQNVFEVNYDNNSYNKGRLLKLKYRNYIHYISLSESDIKSRNSFFQSFPTALTQYFFERNTNKKLYFYFLKPNANIETGYFSFMYRLMKTANTIFLNEDKYLSQIYHPFNSVVDLISAKDIIKSRNSGNASTYIAVNESNTLQIFGKTYGANKYETILIAYAIRTIFTQSIELYEIQDGNLRILPEGGRQMLQEYNINIITSNLLLERKEFDENDSLRSPTYTYNLLDKLGDKKCAFCDCNIPQIIQGAHIWPVASIKRDTTLTQEQKLNHALDKENGLWLCANHHKLFDMNIIIIDLEGRIKYKKELDLTHTEYLCRVTLNRCVDNLFITDSFKRYLSNRNSILDLNLFTSVY